jgi:hypothetical protein
MNLMKSRWRHDCPTLFDALVRFGVPLVWPPVFILMSILLYFGV